MFTELRLQDRRFLGIQKKYPLGIINNQSTH